MRSNRSGSGEGRWAYEDDGAVLVEVDALSGAEVGGRHGWELLKLVNEHVLPRRGVTHHHLAHVCRGRKVRVGIDVSGRGEKGGAKDEGQGVRVEKEKGVDVRRNRVPIQPVWLFICVALLVR